MKKKYYSGCPRTDKGASPLVPSCTVHALFQPGQHIVFLFLAIPGQPVFTWPQPFFLHR